jgi:hypothetical protein
MMPCGSYSSLKHKHLFFKHALLVVADMKVGVKEVGKNSISGLDKFDNDECISVWWFQDHVCNHTNFLFPLAVVDFSGKMC